jgi:molybdate/tungstate transport system permease protein
LGKTSCFGRNEVKYRLDLCLLSFALLGGVLVIPFISILLLLAFGQLADLPYLLGVFSDSQVLGSILLTAGAGLEAVGILALFGTPLAYLLARTSWRWKYIVEGIVDLPLVLPHTVAGLLIYLLFMQRGLLGAPLKGAGVLFEDAYPGIVMAMLFVALPFYVNSVREGFEKVPVHLENAARTLGASRFQAFRMVVLPLSIRHLFNGALLAWGRAISEFAAVIMIAYYPVVVSTLIYQRFTTSGLKEASAVAFSVILFSFVIFLIFRTLTRVAGRYSDRM